MYWGNPELKAVKLNEDMISYSDSIMHFPKIQDYQEGPWFRKRNGNYYRLMLLPAVLRASVMR